MRSSIPRGGVGDSSRKLWRAAGIRVEHTLRTCFIFDPSSPTRASFLPSLSFPRFIFIHASIEPHDISMNLARNRIRVYYSLSFHLPRLYISTLTLDETFIRSVSSTFVFSTFFSGEGRGCLSSPYF